MVPNCWHGRKSRGTGGLVPTNLEWGTLMQIVPQILSCFKISRITFLALHLQCRKMLVMMAIGDKLRIIHLSYFHCHTETRHFK